MASTNKWLGKLKSGAKSVQETAKSVQGTAKTQLGKLTETLDKKLKEAQEDLEKQRAKVELPEPEIQQKTIWRPSVENPDGEIVTIVKQPSIVPSTSQSLPESPQTPTPFVEPPTIEHIRRKPRSTKRNGFTSTSSTSLDTEIDSSNDQRNNNVKQRDNHKEITRRLNNEIVHQEDVNKCLNELIDIVLTVDELVENTTFIVIPQKEDLPIHSDDNIDIEKADSISSENELVQENIQTNIPTDESMLLTNIDNTPITHPDPENIRMNISNDELLTLTNIEDTSIAYPDPENIPINIPNDEIPILTNIDDLPIENSGSENIQMNTQTDELPTVINVDDSLIAHPSPDNIQMNIQDDELPTLTTSDDAPTEDPVLENIPIKISTEELSTLTNIDNASIEQSDSEDELPSLTNIVESPIEHSDSNENPSITSENIIKTPPNELEDSFDELKAPAIQVHQLPEKSLGKLTDLAALREFISKIEGDADVNEESSSPKQDNNILDENIINTSEQLDTLNMMKDTLLSSSLSIPDDIQEYITHESLTRSNSLSNKSSIDEIDEKTSTISIELKFVEKKRFPVVNCHSIPLGTKINQLNCSSTYIYICTNNRKIFYAKLDINYIDYPFKWEQHSDLADRLVVSDSNRTVWRLFNKRLYSSNDPIKFPPIGSQWNEIKIDNEQSLLSMSINDQCGWFIKGDGTLWLIRTDDETHESLNVICPFSLTTVFCFLEKVGVTTCDGEILIRVGCTNDRLEGDGWIFIEHNFGPIDDFVLLTNNNIICIVDKDHRLWIRQWSSDKEFFEILCHDDFFIPYQRYLIGVNSKLLCFTDCEAHIHTFSDSLIGIQWKVIEKNTRLQRLIGAFSNEDYVWALTTDKMICSSNGQKLEKPRQAQYLTHATFVPNNISQNTILWSLDESCCIYVLANIEKNIQWEQVDQSQFEWNRRLIHVVCNHAGVWAVDDQGYIHFRHGHISASHNAYLNEMSLLPPAWIPIPGEAKKHRCFSQIYCGPADWMVYATDNRQTVYARIGINEENRIGTSWKSIEDCSALELAISEHTLWLLTSCGHIQCRENISIMNPIGTRSTTLPGLFLSLTVSVDDSQVWALDSKRNLLKLDRLTVLFEK